MKETLRQNIVVVTPKGVEHSLELWSVVSSGFSTVGPKAEWRMALQNGKLVPVALILRYNANEDAETPNKLMLVSGRGEDHRLKSA